MLIHMNENNSGLAGRRTGLKAAGAAGLTLATGAYGATARKRYAVVGVGSRARMFTGASDALDAGCDVITKKPMTTTAAKAQRIL